MIVAVRDDEVVIFELLRRIRMRYEYLPPVGGNVPASAFYPVVDPHVLPQIPMV